MILAGLSPDELAGLEYNWPFWARPDQLPPPGDWRTWLLMGGRGSGKTRAAAEWVRSEIERGRRAILGVIGPTADMLRKIQVEGPSGLLATARPDNRPSHEPSTRRVVWPNGAVAHLISAEEPDRLRGFNLEAAWIDEIAACQNAELVLDMLQFSARRTGPLGDAPRIVVSTTPKPLPILKALIAAEDTVVTRARTSDNVANLDRGTVAMLQRKYGGTTLGRQELDGLLLDSEQGSLWNRAMIEAARVQAVPPLKRIVVGIDPAGSANANSDLTGIIVAGVDYAGHGYVLADYSGRFSPQGWAIKVVTAYNEFKADRIVAEANYGGQMVESTIREAAPRVPVTMVNASRGKAVRAEPIVALYEQGRIHHVGGFPQLEDQMCEWVPGTGKSPDRLDALVWAATSLMADRQPVPMRRVYINWAEHGGGVSNFGRM